MEAGYEIPDRDGVLPIPIPMLVVKKQVDRIGSYSLTSTRVAAILPAPPRPAIQRVFYWNLDVRRYGNPLIDGDKAVFPNEFTAKSPEIYHAAWVKDTAAGVYIRTGFFEPVRRFEVGDVS